MPERRSPRWPSIPVADWQDARDTFHLHTQVVGKIRMAREPLVNHWWNTTLYVTARGLTTSVMPHPSGPAFPIDLDLREHRLAVTTVDGGARWLALEDPSVADFHAAVMSMLDDWQRLGHVFIVHPTSTDVEEATLPDTSCAATRRERVTRRRGARRAVPGLAP